MLEIKVSEKNLHRVFITAYMLIAAFIIVMICSRSSFLYPFNNWVDVNCFFTVGKSMFNGIVLYKDIYEQKGPLLYFIYGIAYLMSHTTFIGVFLIEIVFAFVYILSIYKISRLYVGFIPSLVISVLSVAVLYSSNTFYYGGSAEELCLPLTTVPMYFLLKCFKDGDGKIDWYKMLISGFSAGCVFLIKYTILSFALVFVIFVIVEFIRRKNYSGIWKAALLYFAGAVISFIPWIIYFAVNGAFGDFFTVYIYNNIFIYSARTISGGRMDIILRELGRPFAYFRGMFLENPLLCVLIIIALLWTALGGFEIKVFSMERIYIPLSFVISFCIMCVGKYVFEYYYTSVGVFAVFGFVALYSIAVYVIKYLYKIIKEKKGRSSVSSDGGSGYVGDGAAEEITAADEGIKRSALSECAKRAIVALAACLITVGLSVGICFASSINISYMGVDKDELFIFRFASVIEKEGGGTILTYGALDFGLYTATDTLPTCKYFCWLNVALDELEETQNEFVEEGKVDFVVCECSYPKNIDLHYELVATDYRQYDDDAENAVVYLFKKTH